MILNDKKIKSLQASGILKIDPFQPDNISPASYDLSIGDFQSINFLNQHTVSMKLDGSVEVLPGESFLASSVEIIGLPNNLTGEIVNRSSTGRKGLFLASPGWIDPGFIGQLTIAMKNETLKPINLTYGQKLWQIVFAECEPADQAYKGHYQDSEGIVEDRTDDEMAGLANLFG